MKHLVPTVPQNWVKNCGA